MKVGYHNPCHLKALGVTREPADLSRLIPGVQVQVFSDQCCGIAGTFGLKKKNYDLSMTIGKKLFNEINASDAKRLRRACGRMQDADLLGDNKRRSHTGLSARPGLQGQSAVCWTARNVTVSTAGG